MDGTQLLFAGEAAESFDLQGNPMESEPKIRDEKKKQRHRNDSRPPEEKHLNDKKKKQRHRNDFRPPEEKHLKSDDGLQRRNKSWLPPELPMG